MNPLSKNYYRVGGRSPFQEVVFLSEEKDINWNDLSEKIPELPRSWFELSRIHSKDRVDFVFNTWMDSLSYHPPSNRLITQFFGSLDDLEIVITKSDYLYSVEMVYSLSDNRSFFRGLPPATKQDIYMFQVEVNENLPEDYYAFLRIHNGFGKLSEIGLLPIEEIPSAMQAVCAILEHQNNFSGRLIDPSTLTPFFESMGSFQCFFSDWYPNCEIGNVFLSGINYRVSDTLNRKTWEEECAFPSFVEWLSKYIEGICT